MLKAAILLNLRIQSTHLSQDVAEKLSGLMPSQISSEVVGDELLLASAILNSIPVFRLEQRHFFKAFIVSFTSEMPPLPSNKCSTNNNTNDANYIRMCNWHYRLDEQN